MHIYYVVMGQFESRCRQCELAGTWVQGVAPEKLTPPATLPPPLQLKGPEAFWRLQANRITLQPKHGLPMRCIPRVKGVAG